MCVARVSLCSDGTSRASDADEPVAVNGSFVYYRGFRVLQATLAALLDRSTPPGPGMPSMAAASRVLLSGSSAGGLTVYLHADWVADAVHAVAPAALVLAVPEVGFFIDGASSAFTQAIQIIAALMPLFFASSSCHLPFLSLHLPHSLSHWQSGAGST